MLSPFLEMRLEDMFDIVLVTTLLYTALALIRRTKAAFVAIGILIVGALYIIARALDLRLTAWIFQGFFAVFLLVIIVVFQEELRQLFERIALWSLGRRDVALSQADTTDVVVQCLAELARDSIGALIVIPGVQPIHRHIRGGIELNGKLSIPLLRSIFDTNSPGHDGAVIVENDRISTFATHLPLSKDFAQLSRVGTRHSAALGLTERTDALCLVVSEERGQISVARDAQLRALGSSQELGAVVHEFLEQKGPAGHFRHGLTQLLRENSLQKGIVFALVVALWYVLVPGSRRVELSYTVPVVVHNLPTEFALDAVEPPTVRATLAGLRRTFYLFKPEGLEVTIDASLAKLGRRTFRLSADNLEFPKDLVLRDFEPSQVKLSLRDASAVPPDGNSNVPASGSSNR
jgi:uncharacterized protein (TIGR00159 family)